jgi:hypothetical protein
MAGRVEIEAPIVILLIVSRADEPIMTLNWKSGINGEFGENEARQIETICNEVGQL